MCRRGNPAPYVHKHLGRHPQDRPKRGPANAVARLDADAGHGGAGERDLLRRLRLVAVLTPITDQKAAHQRQVRASRGRVHRSYLCRHRRQSD